MNREDFLRRLKAIRPALTSNKAIVQGDCIAFRRGYMMTYADEISCRIPSGIDKQFTGAIPAARLLKQLGKWKDREIHVTAHNGRLRVISMSRRRQAWFGVQEVTQLSDKVEMPGADAWRRLPKGFIEAVETVGMCASQKKSKWETTCIHIHPERIEALSALHGCQWLIRSGFKRPILVKQEALQHIVSAAPDRLAETKGWVHFRNRRTKLMLSCRRYADTSGFPDAAPGLEVYRSHVVSLARIPPDEIERAAVFSAETDKDRVLVEIGLERNTGRISGEGISGSYEGKPFAINWDGEGISFYIAPKILMDICSRHQTVLIGCGRAAAKAGQSPNRLKAVVDRGHVKYTYVTSLVRES
jgi:hypothetical protein